MYISLLRKGSVKMLRNKMMMVSRRSKSRSFVAVAACLSVLALGGVHPGGRAQERKAEARGLPDLVGGLKATPGCLGVETARTASGKQVIFAWFENKKAVLNWYYSDMHRSVSKQFFPGAPERTPMADIPDDGSPILAIASLTPAE